MAEIFKTKDYSIFLKTSNRYLIPSHVDRLVNSFSESKYSFSISPIAVSKHLYVIDGQHRLKAAERLGEYIYYTVHEKIVTLKDVKKAIRDMNVNQVPWKIKDHVSVFSQDGLQEYQFLENLMNKYENFFPLSSIYHICKFDLSAWKNRNSLNNKCTSLLKTGEAVILNKNELVKFLDTLCKDIKCRNINSRYMRFFKNAKYLKAMYQLFYEPTAKFRYELFFKKIPEFCDVFRTVSSEYEATICLRDICFAKKK